MNNNNLEKCSNNFLNYYYSFRTLYKYIYIYLFIYIFYIYV